jgi:hypothetical protein
MGAFMSPRLKWWIAALLLCLAPAAVLAQDPTCPQIVQQALAAADAACVNTGRNQACYGNVNLSAIPQPNVTDFAFNTTGDLANVTDIQQMTLSGMDTASGQWGVALLKLQANLPETMPGQNVTFLLFGNVEVTNAVSEDNPDGLKPMQAFYLKTGLRDSQCVEAPESGMLVQTPQGVGEVQFNVNGVDVQMGSTVFFQADAEQGMSVSTLEGAAYVLSEGERQVIVPGTWVRVPLKARDDDPEGFAPAGLPELPESYGGRIDFLKALPFDLLERKIELADPLSEEQVAALRQQIEDHLRDGTPLCGEDPFPSCDKFDLSSIGDNFQRDCVFPPRSADDKRPLCAEVTPPPPNTDIVDNRPCVNEPGPGNPPMPANETRPFCATPVPQNSGVVDDRPCVYKPGPGDPPMPASETRPFCPPPGPNGEASPPPSFDQQVPPPPSDPQLPSLPSGG